MRNGIWAYCQVSTEVEISQHPHENEKYLAAGAFSLFDILKTRSESCRVRSGGITHYLPSEPVVLLPTRTD